MKAIIPTASILRRAFFVRRAYQLVPPSRMNRRYATSEPVSTGFKRRAVTPFNDDGQVPWTALSGAEKAARAAQQTFNVGIIVVGVCLTAGVVYFLFTDVVSAESKVNHYHRAFDRIRTDARCTELLGDASKMTAYGDATASRWRRARPVASTEKTDPRGNHHLLMQFWVDGPLNRGSVHVHLVKPAGRGEYEYKYLYVDVKGHQRIYLENTDADPRQGRGTAGTRLFGIDWK